MTTMKNAKQLEGARILAIDDDQVALARLQSTLEEAGCFVETATNGFAGMSILSVIEFDVVLLDLQMPELEGTETARRIRSGGLGSLAQEKVIMALTDEDSPELEESCYAAGMDGYLTKPLDLTELQAELVRWAGKGWARQAG